MELLSTWSKCSTARAKGPCLELWPVKVDVRKGDKDNKENMRQSYRAALPDNQMGSFSKTAHFTFSENPYCVYEASTSLETHIQRHGKKIEWEEPKS